MLRPTMLRVAILAILIGSSLAAGVTATHAQGAQPPGMGLGVRSHAPRKVNPHQTVEGAPKAIYSRVRGEAPPGLGGGKPTGGLPPILPDVPTKGLGHTHNLATLAPVSGLQPFANTGNTADPFANLVEWSGARFDNTCVKQLDGSCSGAEPPDTQMAAGTNEIVEAVNNNVFVFTRGGTLITSFPVSNIFTPSCTQPNCPASVGFTDPKIVFDSSTDMYYMTEMVCPGGGCGGSSWTDMGISLAVTSTPAGTWNVYDTLNDETTDLQDQEKLGFSGDKITFAVNDYGCKCGSGSKFKQENVGVIQKSEAVAGQTIDYQVDSTNSTSSFVFDSMPTTPINASTSDNTQYVVWDGQQSSSNYLTVIRITGTPDGGGVNFTSSVNQPSMANQTALVTPVQPGGTLAGDKQNFQSAMVQGTDLWAVATDGCTPTYPTADNATRDCTRLVEVDLSGGGASVVTDTDIGDTGEYRINPSVSKDTDGHVFFGFTRSSSTVYATASIDGSGTPFPSVLQRFDMVPGDSSYTGSRWGDYSGTQQDPADTHDVWTAQEYGACETGCNNFNFGGNWATELGQFTYQAPSITSISPTQGPADGGTTVNIYGSELGSGAPVMFGGTAAASVTFVSSTHIQAVSPAEDSGTVDITTSTAAGTSATSAADQFTYSPVLYSVNPLNGPAVGGQTVTITGAGLNGPTAVSFGGTPAASFTPVDSSTIEATTPMHAGGTVNLTVTTGGGTSNAISYTFMFPTTTSLASSANPSGPGQAVTFTATVNPVTDGGTMAFSDNGSPIATCQTVSVDTTTGKAPCTVTYAAVGSHNIVATYSGDFNYSGSTSTPLVQQVTYIIKVLYSQTKVNNSGSNVPIRVELDDAAGNNVSSASIVVTVTGLSPSPAPGTAPSGNFTYMLLGTGPGYQLNVKTTKYPKNTYTLSFTVTGDPVTHTVEFVIG